MVGHMRLYLLMILYIPFSNLCSIIWQWCSLKIVNLLNFNVELLLLFTKISKSSSLSRSVLCIMMTSSFKATWCSHEWWGKGREGLGELHLLSRSHMYVFDMTLPYGGDIVAAFQRCPTKWWCHVCSSSSSPYYKWFIRLPGPLPLPCLQGNETQIQSIMNFWTVCILISST